MVTDMVGSRDPRKARRVLGGLAWLRTAFRLLP